MGAKAEEAAKLAEARKRYKNWLEERRQGAETTKRLCRAVDEAEKSTSDFEVGDRVVICDFVNNGTELKNAVITKALGSDGFYEVQFDESKSRKRTVRKTYSRTKRIC